MKESKESTESKEFLLLWRYLSLSIINKTQHFSLKMGTWKLEAVKMTVYISFPVIVFHIFNNPQIFEEHVINRKREWYKPRNSQVISMLEEVKAECRKKRELAIEQEYLKLH